MVGHSAIKVGQQALYRSGAFRGLIAFARTTRSPELPDVPTGRELVSDPKAQALLAFAETPFFMALPVVAPPDPVLPGGLGPVRLGGRLGSLGHAARMAANGEVDELGGPATGPPKGG